MSFVNPTPDSELDAEIAERRKAGGRNDEITVIGPPAPMPTVEELCDALHREEEGNETHSIPTHDLLAITSLLQSHPEWWDYPCFCAECRSYAHV